MKRKFINKKKLNEYNKKRNITIEFEKDQNISKEKVKVPINWKEIWNGIENMRKENIAPVDTMGCESLAEKEKDEKIVRYQTLIGLMLSSQTKDKITSEAMKKLKDYGLTIDNILQTDEKKIDELINKVGFHKRKANYIKRTTEILKKEYNNDIPDTIEDLLKLPGVGLKMANLCMQVAWKKTVGIGVDVHVHRISNRLHWVKTNTPEQTKKELESWLPQEYWKSINKLLVGFGQTICTPLKPKCNKCKINNLCPSAFKIK